LQEKRQPTNFRDNIAPAFSVGLVSMVGYGMDCLRLTIPALVSPAVSWMVDNSTRA